MKYLRLRWLILAALAGFDIAGGALAAATIHGVIQKGRRFDLQEIEIAVGDTLSFSNQDEFLHQIYVKSDQFNFESAEQSPGQTVDVKFTKAGTFSVLCEIHPKMHLTVTVK